MKIYSLIFVLILFGSLSVQAQNSSRRASRRATATAKPKTVPQRPVQAEVLMTADQILQQEQASNSESVTLDAATGKRVKAAKSNTTNKIQPQTEVLELTRQVTALTNKIKSLEEGQRNLLDLERLTRTEERAESLRRQLSSAIEKEAALNSKLEELTNELRPENIERTTSVVGSTRPEDVRETRRKMLENESTRVREQLANLQIARTKLESAVANADVLVEKLRARVEKEMDEETDETEAKTENSENEDTNPPDDPDEENPNPPFSD